MNSREYANKLRELADWLDGRPEFKTDSEPIFYMRYFDKKEFLAAVVALKPGTKKYTEGSYPEVEFIPDSAPKNAYVKIAAPRHVACRKVQEAKWECEPLLSPSEDAEIESVRP